MADCPKETVEDVILAAMTGPRRVVSDGIDYQDRSATEIIALARFAGSVGAKCGFGSIVAQQAIPPNALGVNLGRSSSQLGSYRIW